MRAWLLCAFCACWHSEALAPTPTRALVAIRKPPPAHERDLDLQPGDDPSQLSTFLWRSRDPITSLVDGPVVTVDIATATVDTRCGTSAEDVVRRWTASVRDPDGEMVWCERGKRNDYTLCMQWNSTHSELLMLLFRYSDRWQLSAMITGPIGHVAAWRNGSALFAALSAARCP